MPELHIFDSLAFVDNRGWAVRRGNHRLKQLLKPKRGKAGERSKQLGQGMEVLRGRSAFKRSQQGSRLVSPMTSAKVYQRRMLPRKIVREDIRSMSLELAQSVVEASTAFAFCAMDDDRVTQDDFWDLLEPDMTSRHANETQAQNAALHSHADDKNVTSTSSHGSSSPRSQLSCPYARSSPSTVDSITSMHGAATGLSAPLEDQLCEDMQWLQSSENQDAATSACHQCAAPQHSTPWQLAQVKAEIAAVAYAEFLLARARSASEPQPGRVRNRPQPSCTRRGVRDQSRFHCYEQLRKLTTQLKRNWRFKERRLQVEDSKQFRKSQGFCAHAARRAARKRRE